MALKMLCYDGRLSLYCFIGTLLPFLLFSKVLHNFLFSVWGFAYYFPLSYYILVNVILRVLYKNHAYQIAVRSALLGFLFSLGIYINLIGPIHVKTFGIYMCVMSAFHYGEFLCMAYIQPKLVSTDSFVINHSLQYTLAAITSWSEFFLESYFFPGLKTYFWLSYVGLAICVVGDGLRKLAMLTAHSNFNHLVQCEKSDDHVLITHGVYSLFRHPSYVGWFYWSIGTQIILMNPVCIVAYTLASWFFFRERVTIEEIMLLNFFGQQYCDYQQNVGTGLPFISGYKL